jgi:uridine phosphorylase
VSKPHTVSLPQPVHLRPHADVSERVLLPGDPGRALRLAQQVVEVPKMLNHHRGLWGYTGIAADGEPLTIQSTGIGGPSTAIVVEELIALGARRLVRVGTCRALTDLPLGSLVVPDRVRAEDGASRALGADGTLAPDPELLAALRAGGVSVGEVVSTDLYYDPRPARWEGAVAVDLSAAALLAVAGRHGARAACVLVVSDSPDGRIEAEALERAEVQMGRVAAAAVGV